MEDESESQAIPLEGDRSSRDTRVLTPEEVARNFLRLRGEATHDPRTQPTRASRRKFRSTAATIAIVLVAVAVLAGLAAITLLPNKQASPPAAQAPSHHSSGGSVASTSTTTTVPSLAHNAITVDVLNAYGSGRVASLTATSLKGLGFNIGSVVNAPSDIPSGQPSQILYGPDALLAANTLAQSLSGPLTETSTSALSGNHVALWVASPQLTVKTP